MLILAGKLSTVVNAGTDTPNRALAPTSLAPNMWHPPKAGQAERQYGLITFAMQMQQDIQPHLYAVVSLLQRTRVGSNRHRQERRAPLQGKECPCGTPRSSKKHIDIAI